MVDPLDKIKSQNLWLRELTRYEHQALSMCQEIDLMTCEPEIVQASGPAMLALFNYWRVVLSSEPQKPNYAGQGRLLPLIIRDRVSGGFLGIVALSDPPTYWTQLMEHLKWEGNVEGGKARRQEHQHRIIMMRRCLPVYEFGQMTGGKLLALAATSRDVIRLLELRYSFQYLLFGIRTLHGKGSQYNRLQQRGIELLDVDETDHGFYAMELRKKAVSFMRGEADAYGKTSTYTIKEQIDYWRERWLPARMASLSVGSKITLDPKRYRLSDQLESKKLTPAHLTKEGTNDEADVEETHDE